MDDALKMARECAAIAAEIVPYDLSQSNMAYQIATAIRALAQKGE